MIYEICNFLLPLSDSLSFCRLVHYISFRAIVSALTAVILVLVFSRRFILFVHRRCFLDQVRETGVRSAFDKGGTPTMGGVLIIGAVLVSMAVWGNWHSPFMLCSVAGMVWFGLLGLWDDVSKVRRRSGDRGISERTKLLLQGFFSLVFAWICVGPYAPLGSALATKVCIPFYKYPLIDIGPWLYGLFIFLFVIFVSNAVNITDGLDGLAVMPSIFVLTVLGIFAYVEGNRIYSSYLYYPFLRGAGELAVFGAAFVGAGLGFLWYNAYPAQIFMGDTGSLALGGGIGVVAIFIKKELLLFVVGGIFVIEALSVVLQVIWFKTTKKRLFLMSPIHHHFQLLGWAESKVTIRFWIVAIVMALLSLATLKLQ